jgi:hypothetical protein
MKRIFFAAVLMAIATIAYAAPVLNLIPTVAGGSAGGVTGWGFDITNPDPVNFVVLNDSFVTGGLSTGVFGNYVDYIASNFIAIGPNGDTGPVAFNRATLSGVGEFDFNPVVPPATRVSGTINIDYSLFSQDPNDPNFDPGSFVGSGTVSAVGEADIVPEPGSGVLVGLTLLLVAFPLWRRRAIGAEGPSADRCGSPGRPAR